MKLMNKLPQIAIAFSFFAIFLEQWQKGYFKRVKSYFGTFNIKPYLIIFVLFIVLFVPIFIFDLYLIKQVEAAEGQKWVDWIARFGRQIGRNNNFWMYVILAYFVSRRLFKKQAIHFLGVILSSALAGIVCTVMKFTFLRARPENNLGPYSFFHLDGALKDSSLFQSFPSGDVVLVAGAAGYCFFALRRYAVRWFIFLLPLATAISRMARNDHWPSDTLVSVGLGVMMGKLVWDYHQTLRSNPSAGR
jgi:membrane-associated phospholipid phosphatase